MTKHQLLNILLIGLIGVLILATIIVMMNAGGVNNVTTTVVPVSPNAGSDLLSVDVPTPAAALVGAPSEPWVKELFLKNDEIPVGWILDNTTWDGESLGVGYITVPRQTGVSLGEDIAFYSTTLLAEQAFSRTLDQYFPQEYIKYWKAVPELAFPNQADTLKVACLPSTLDGVPFQACTSIARYKKLIVKTFGNVFRDKWLTMASYRQMLEAVDRRVTEVLSQNP